MSLMDLLPVDYADSTAVVEIQEALEMVADAGQIDAEDLRDQMFVDTATWGLSYWEQLYGITTSTSKTYEQRRTAIKGKMMGKGTATVEAIRNLVETMVGGAVSVIEENNLYQFVVKMEEILGVPSNILEIREAIEEIKPAHLAYEIVFKYNTHNDLSTFIHDALELYTHDELRDTKIVFQVEE